MHVNRRRCLLCTVFLSALAVARADYAYVDNGDGTATITGYSGPGGAVSIPDRIDGLDITRIGDGAFALQTGLTHVTPGRYTVSVGAYAFAYCDNLAGVSLPAGVASIGISAFEGCVSLADLTLPESIHDIGQYAFTECAGLTTLSVPAGMGAIGVQAFRNCTGLTAVHFHGNAPAVNAAGIYGGSTLAISYHPPLASGWTDPWAGRPALPWAPQVDGGAAFGVQGDTFGFTVTNAGSPVVVIEASPAPGGPEWTPLATNALTGGAATFADPRWMEHASRFYRFRMP